MVIAHPSRYRNRASGCSTCDDEARIATTPAIFFHSSQTREQRINVHLTPADRTTAIDAHHGLDVAVSLFQAKTQKSFAQLERDEALPWE